MVALPIKHDTKWVSPSPLWVELSDTADADVRNTFQRPAILRFDTDDFMDELLNVMQYYPERLIEWQAQPETWREPMTPPQTRAKLTVSEPLSTFKQSQTRQLKKLSLDTSTSTPDVSISIEQTAEKPLKLFHPAHQRFYLVTASLVCRKMGLPDRCVDLAKQQKVEFVIRRLLPKDDSNGPTPVLCNPDDCDEYAYIAGENGSRWRKVQQGTVSSDRVLLPQEERLPMFNLNYDENEEKKRRMLAGFIPVGKRETYVGAELDESDGNSGSESASDNTAVSSAKRDAITHLFSMQVAGPWKNVIAQAYNESSKSDDWSDHPPPLIDVLDVSPIPTTGEENNIRLTRESIQTTSWYVLVDLLQFLKDYLVNVYDYIDNAAAPAGITAEEQALYDALASVTLSAAEYVTFRNEVNTYYAPNPVFITSLTAALKYLIDHPEIETDLDLVDYPYERKTQKNTEHDWPNFLFPLADPVNAYALPSPLLAVSNPSDDEPGILQDQIDALTELVRAAIPDNVSKAAPNVVPFKTPKIDRRDGWFVIRCVFETPNCGPLNLPVVSERTVPFKMSAFFDPDAPGRPITIPMPLDISPAGLRKYNRNASFMISDMLCGKLKKMRKTTLGDLVLSVLPWPFHKDLSDPGDTGSCSSGGTNWGMICSFSIPIVTLCAMIMLIIMVTLFDIFFRWLPLLFLCLPVPGLKGKKDA